MQGAFLPDASLIQGLSIQESLRYCCSLRLAIMYDAPRDVQEKIIARGQPYGTGAAMITFGTEWQFLLALHLLRYSPEDARIQKARDHLCTMPLSKYTVAMIGVLADVADDDYVKSVEIIDCLRLLSSDVFKGIAAIDKLTPQLEPRFGNLHGKSPSQDAAESTQAFSPWSLAIMWLRLRAAKLLQPATSSTLPGLYADSAPKGYIKCCVSVCRSMSQSSRTIPSHR